MGVCIADVDADGWDDLYVTALGGNRLYRNNHDGTFADATAAARRHARRLVGRLRLRRLRPRRRPRPVRQPLRQDRPRRTCPSSARARRASTAASPVQCGPRGLPGETDLLFRNEGDGRFTDVSEKAGVHDPRGALRAGGRLVRRERGRLARPLRRQRLERELPVPQPARTARSRRPAFPRGVAVSEDGAEQGEHGRRGRRLRPQRALQPLHDQLRRGVQRALPQRRRALHRRFVPLEDGARAACPTSAGARRSSTTTTTAGST